MFKNCLLEFCPSQPPKLPTVQCFPCHGWSRTLADLVKGFICYSEEQIPQKQTRKQTVYLTVI